MCDAVRIGPDCMFIQKKIDVPMGVHFPLADLQGWGGGVGLFTDEESGC